MNTTKPVQKENRATRRSIVAQERASVNTRKGNSGENNSHERNGDRDSGDADDGGINSASDNVGYIRGPRVLKPLPDGAVWMTTPQLLRRYGGRSAMWLWRKLRDDPDFPKPIYMGPKNRMFSVAECDAYDRNLILKRTA